MIWANGGAQAKNLVGGLIPLDDKLPDLISKLVGKSAFTGPDGKLYFIPTTLQGHVVYYNKKLYKDAGLDPNKPPTTWAEVTKMCDAFKAKGEAACFMMANKEGYEAEFFLSEMANQSLTAQQQADWLAGKLHWSDAPIKAILQTWVDTSKDGWYQEGGNSQTMFMDEFTLFAQGDGRQRLGPALQRRPLEGVRDGHGRRQCRCLSDALADRRRRPARRRSRRSA